MMEVDDEPQTKRGRTKEIAFVPGEKRHQIVVPSDLRMASINGDFIAERLAPKGWRKEVKRKREKEDLNPIDNPDAATANVHVDITTIRDTAREASGVGKVSSRPWKVPAKRASETKTNPLLKTSWDKKMAEKATRASFLEHKRSTLAVRKEKLKAETKRRAAVKEQKEANRLKSQVVQKVSTATAKKMMKDKKQRKKLVTA